MKTIIKHLLNKLFKKKSGATSSSSFMGTGVLTTTFEVQNNDPDPKQFRVLGDNWNGTQAPGVDAEVAESSLGQVTRDTLTNAWMIDKFKVITNNPNNFTHPLYIIFRSATGYQAKQLIHMSTWQNPQDANPNIVVSPDNMNILVTGDIGFEGTLEGNSNMSIIAFRKPYKSKRTKAVNKSSNFLEDALKKDNEAVVILGGQQLSGKVLII